MKKIRLALVDVLGLHYDGSTLSKRGLGGSESAIILISKELAKLNFEVTVYNDCISGDANPGIYDGVIYKPLYEVENDNSEYDIFIASRSVAPFANPEDRGKFKSFLSMPNFNNILNNSKYKILWMHDTFCDGDNLIEDFVLQGRIDKIFTLSDFHSSYVLNADHGKKRIFEVLKPYIFQTRNGMVKHINQVDITKKDRNLFVYNASATKGMVPLVTKIWSKVKEKIPTAKLTVIGGFYRFKPDQQPDAQENTVRQLMTEYPDINFTGVISQTEIAEILSKASFMIYPAAFPETFGISTLESLYYNTPLLTCNFGALEETAIHLACYKINYAIEPNWTCQWLNTDSQIDQFVNMTVNAYHNTYLHQQKMYACNQIHDICGWETIALQWKYHFSKKLGFFFSPTEYQEVMWINNRVREVFGRRFINKEENQEPLYNNSEYRIEIVTPVYNAEKYIAKCILSVAQQDYSNYKMTIIDDNSTDNTVETIINTIESLPDRLSYKFNLVRNHKNVGAVRNQIETIEDIILDAHGNDSIFMLLDGDDWLVNNQNIFRKYSNLYHKGAEFTYGSCWSVVDNIPLIAQPYPEEIKTERAYRKYMFNWKMPYTHLRTFRSSTASKAIFKGNEFANFKDENGNWYRAGGDTSVFYNMIEEADPSKVICVPDIVYFYNDTNPLNDYKINSEEQTKTSDKIIGVKKNNKTEKRLRELSAMPLLPKTHIDYLKWIKSEGLTDDVKVIYDIGACVLHWTNEAKKIWDATFITFDALGEAKFLYEESNLQHYCGVLSDEVKNVEYYKNVEHPGGNSIYKENVVYSPTAPELYKDSFVLRTRRLEDVVSDNKFELPDLIKMDVQGSELDILKGAGKKILDHCKHIILELPHVEYNIGAPKAEATINFLKENGFIMMNPNFPNHEGAYDGDYYFIKNKHLEEYNMKKNNTSIATTNKKILIAVPTAKYIEPETFKSIYDQEIPDGYDVDFQFFYGYQIDQIRNLIAHWVEVNYDYLFSVDSDIIFEKDTLKKMLARDVPLVTGIYKQRFEEQHLEIYDLHQRRMGQFEKDSLFEIGGCGFGCVLVKSEVIKSIGYPQFVYKSALDHSSTLSEDNYFCLKAREKGYKLFCDSTIICDHKGTKVYKVAQ